MPLTCDLEHSLSILFWNSNFPNSWSDYMRLSVFSIIHNDVCEAGTVMFPLLLLCGVTQIRVHCQHDATSTLYQQLLFEKT